MEELENLIIDAVTQDEEWAYIPIRSLSGQICIEPDIYDTIFCKSFEHLIMHTDEERDDVEYYGNGKFDERQFKVDKIFVDADNIIIQINWDV